MTAPEELNQPPWKFHLDLDTGDVYERDDNGNWYFQGTVPGTGGGFPGDGAAPPKVTGLHVDVAYAQQPDGTVVPALAALWDVSPAPDVLTYEVEYDDDDTFATPQTVSVGGTFAGLYPVLGGTTYFVRVRALDADALKGPWSDTASNTAPGDEEAPPIPGDLTVLPGYRMLGVTWEPATVNDLDHYDVRWTPDKAGAPDLDRWSLLSTKSDHIAITNLAEAVTSYWVQVRAVDRSDNVATSVSDDTAVPSKTNGDAGWSPAVGPTATTLVPPEALTIDEAMILMLTSGTINADLILTGSLRVGKTGVAGSILIYDQFGVLQGSWDSAGMLMVNPNNVKEAMWLKGGSLRFTDAFTGNVSGSDWKTAVGTTLWNTAITPRGIDVSAITFGSIYTGSNLVPNAGCELTAFSATGDATKVWDLTTDWDDASGGINLDVTTGDLKLTVV